MLAYRSQGVQLVGPKVIFEVGKIEGYADIEADFAP
jgi:hypothetical protein